ncbi:hypothetical protein [Corynebacterium timonense]|uniref:Uncharacterized protein n=1 Tax=Corynebacterium timonense TaxID=441500 RepID=A0A1H1LV69_9CORY|nr:hypothetical protein [Corynebacterium timonense]SDR77659.1 hypothetical protein SAMN04488539_0325 [Corynebacterium timonense]
MTITRTHFDGVTPITETLPHDNLAEAVEATLAHAREKYRHATVKRMDTTSVDVWACNNPDFRHFGQGYYLKIK